MSVEGTVWPHIDGKFVGQWDFQSTCFLEAEINGGGTVDTNLIHWFNPYQVITGTKLDAATKSYPDLRGVDRDPLKECEIGSNCLSRIRSSLVAGCRTWRIKQWPLHRWALTHLIKKQSHRGNIPKLCCPQTKPMNESIAKRASLSFPFMLHSWQVFLQPTASNWDLGSWPLIKECRRGSVRNLSGDAVKVFSILDGNMFAWKGFSAEIQKEKAQFSYL